jgi:hypothetical protein
MRPAPPDLTVSTVSADRAFDIITNGYPGTAMPSWRAVPEEARWGLVKVVQGFYAPDERSAGGR